MIPLVLFVIILGIKPRAVHVKPALVIGYITSFLCVLKDSEENNIGMACSSCKRFYIRNNILVR